MLPALYDDQRREIKRVAMSLMFSAAAILPMAAHGSSVAMAQDSPFTPQLRLPEVPGRLTFPQVVVKRDPFRSPEQVREGLAFGEASSSERDPSQSIGIVLPPNSGADGMLPAGPQALAVRAIIVGNDARALIDTGASVRVFRIGDMVGSAKVVAITAAGVRLADGTMLPLAGAK